MMRKRILITGATGFVGRQILRSLSNSDLTIVVRDVSANLIATMPNIKTVVPTANLFLECEEWWADQCSDHDIVIHAAWYAEPGKYLHSPQNLDCLVGSLNLVKGAAKAGVKKIVGIGTCFEYDQKLGVLSIDTPLKPLTPYASAKAALFLSLSQWLPAEKIQFSWCRLFYLYGDGEDQRRLVPYIRKQIQKGEPAELTSGKQIRDYMNVSDAGIKIAEVALSDCTGPVNVCSGMPITVRQLAERIAGEYGRQDLLKFDARPDNLFDPPCVIGIPNA